MDLQEMNAMNASQIVSKVVYGALPLFYLVPPSQSSFQTIPEVPNYVRKVSSPTLGATLPSMIHGFMPQTAPL